GVRRGRRAALRPAHNLAAAVAHVERRGAGARRRSDAGDVPLQARHAEDARRRRARRPTMEDARMKRLAFLFVALAPLVAEAAERPAAVDRVVVRWSARASTGTPKPRFIMARELAFEARIEALSEGKKLPSPYLDKHVRAAIQRHITEEFLAELPVDPPPD